MGGRGYYRVGEGDGMGGQGYFAVVGDKEGELSHLVVVDTEAAEEACMEGLEAGTSEAGRGLSRRAGWWGGSGGSSLGRGESEKKKNRI